MNSNPYPVLDRFLNLQTNWFTLIGEHLKDTQDNVLEYWRVEKEDSIIVLPIQNQQLILPPPTYRPGLGEATLDFPGGRSPKAQDLQVNASTILDRELGIVADAIAEMTLLNPQGWPVNSSFSNQKLYGFVATIQPTFTISASYVDSIYPVTLSGVQLLLDKLICCQCRAVLLHWYFRHFTRYSHGQIS